MSEGQTCIGCHKLMRRLDKYQEICDACNITFSDYGIKFLSYYSKCIGIYLVEWYIHSYPETIICLAEDDKDTISMRNIIKIKKLIDPNVDEKYIRMLMTFS